VLDLQLVPPRAEHATITHVLDVEALGQTDAWANGGLTAQRQQ
jgi:hypothetical protein